MIKVKQEKSKNCSCDNCNRQMLLILKYEFFDKGRQNPHTKLHLCEDCSNAMASMHRYCIEEGKTLKYDLDEITEVNENTEWNAKEGKLNKGITDKLLMARDRELDYLAELIHQERHCGETDEQLRKRILKELRRIGGPYKEEN